MKEEWKPISGYGFDYFVSNLGRIASRKDGFRILKPSVGSGGYYHVALSKHSKTTTLPVHRLVLETFVGKRPDGMEARHLDGHKLNNRRDNLVWGTRSENSKDKFRHGTHIRGEKNPSSKLTAEDVIKIRLLHKQGHTNVEIAKLFGLEKSHVSDIVTGKAWDWLKGEKLCQE
jgi:hypothetical protein